MLKQRIITAVLLIIPLIAAVLWLADYLFALLLAVIVVLAAWEWAGLAGTPGGVARTFYGTCVAGLLLGSYMLPMTGVMLIIFTSIAAWLAALVAVVGYERGWCRQRLHPLLMWLVGWLILVPAWLGLVVLRNDTPAGEYWVLLLFVLIWGADSAAYFSGRRWGTHRLAATVSPGKTMEGVVGGLIAVLILVLAAIYSAPLPLKGGALIGFILLALVTSLISVIGDLVESLFKRLAGVKDSGRILPGHGGVLDRIDSLTAAAPVFVAGLWWLGVYI